MQRIIIDYPDDMLVTAALARAADHCEQGRISTARGIKHFCWVTVQRAFGVKVSTRIRRTKKAADSLIVEWDK